MSDFAPAGGSGYPFPPEKPRTDIPAPPPPPPAMHQTAATAAWGSGAAPPQWPVHPIGGFRDENRRMLDGKRVGAYLIDLLVLIPGACIFFKLFGFHPAAQLLWCAVALAYFFTMEARTGQTLGKRAMGLRVMAIDGGPAKAGAVAGRTVFRLIDGYIIGLLVLVLSGKRRQRIGDLVTGTIVRRDDRPYTPAPRSPLLTIYPMVWIASALAVSLHLGLIHKPVSAHGKRTADPFMASVDRVCEKRVRAEARLGNTENFPQMYRYSLWETDEIQALGPAPRRVRKQYKSVLRYKHRLDRMAGQIISDARRSTDPQATADAEYQSLKDLAIVANERFRELGLPYCAQ